MKALFTLLLLGMSSSVFAVDASNPIDFTQHWAGYCTAAVFLIAFLLVIFEEQLHLHKSKPVLSAAAIVWLIIAIAQGIQGNSEALEASMRHTFLEYAELFFFLLVAMTYINAMIERGVFDALRDWLISKQFGYKTLFWITGILAFCISPVADNLTTALIMCAVVLAVGKEQPAFITLSCINIVIAANAGGAFSPFGDITTLMVWQKGVIGFWTFFKLFLPALANFLLPAMLMQLALPSGSPSGSGASKGTMKAGGGIIVGLFLATIATAVFFHNFLHIPPVFGMMAGLAYLKMFAFYLSRKSLQWAKSGSEMTIDDNPYAFNIFHKIAQAEWDTLFFFYGVIMCVGALGYVGYLALLSTYLYDGLGATTANVLIGVLSALVDNIPIMFSVLSMNPAMSEHQWLLVTMTAGVGGSLLSIGSAAGVALMGQARGYYTFFSHLRWSPVIGLGYAASIWLHFLINGP